MDNAKLSYYILSLKLNCSLFSHFISEELCSMRLSSLSNGIRHSPHPSLRKAPGISLSLQFSHDVVQEDITGQKDRQCLEDYRPELSMSHPLPGELGLIMAPITASVARVALKSSLSNHLFKMCSSKQGKKQFIRFHWH